MRREVEEFKANGGVIKRIPILSNQSEKFDWGGRLVNDQYEKANKKRGRK